MPLKNNYTSLKC